MDLTGFAADVGESGEVTITGASSRGGPVPGVRTVRAPTGIDWLRGDEMTACCGAGTLVAELDEALAAVGQCVAIPPSGTVGGALAVGHSGLRRLGHGPVRDTLLQARYVSAAGHVVKAGGPTVKNVSGFDLCRLLVGSYGTLGFLGEVILRTRPRARYEQWFETDTDPIETLARLYRPTSVLWDGTTTWVLLEGHPDDVTASATAAELRPTAGPPPLPTGGRWSIPPTQLTSLRGTFVAEVGVGVVHHAEPPPPVEVDASVRELNRRIKHNFDPTGRLNPGIDVLQIGVFPAGQGR
jgi:glycolate oxidase FAD binding subunit